MKTKRTILPEALLVMWILTGGAISGFARRQQTAAPIHADAALRAQEPVPYAAAHPAAPILARVEIAREAKKTIVRVEGNGPLEYETMRLDSPDRVVLDFTGARLALPQNLIPSALAPVRGVRAGLFKPGVARVVIDLSEAVPYRITSQENSVTVEFDVSAAAPAGAPLAAPSSGSAAERLAAARPPGSANAAKSVAVEVTKPARPEAAGARREPAAAHSSSLVSHVSPEAEPAPFVNSFANGMLTFRAQGHPLRAILKRIGMQTGVSIVVADGVGNEPLSTEFHHFRVDEALRQVLKGHDAFFLYGVDEQAGGQASLRGVWVFPAGRGRVGMQAPSKSEMAEVKETGPLPADPDPAARAHAIETLIRRKGRHSGAIVLAALKDSDEKVRSRALYRALLSGADISQDTLIQLVLNDDSANVRFLALQALPLDPSLRWVAERAVNDSSQSISDMAQDILRELDAASGSSAATNSNRPPES